MDQVRSMHGLCPDLDHCKIQGQSVKYQKYYLDQQQVLMATPKGRPLLVKSAFLRKQGVLRQIIV